MGYILEPPVFPLIRRGTRLVYGLVGAWPITENPRPVVLEESGTNVYNFGTFGGTTGLPTWQPGPEGYSINFVSANSQYITFPTNTQTSYAFANTTFSVYIRAKYNTNAASGFIVVCDLNSGASTGGWGFNFFSNAAIQMSTKNSGGATCASAATATTYNDGLFHDIVGVCTTDTATAANNIIKIYVDGILTTGAAGATTYGAPTQPLRFGSRTDQPGTTPVNPLNGNISAVFIWNRALTAEDVALLSFDPFLMFRPKKVLKPSPAVIYSFSQASAHFTRKIQPIAY